MDTKNGNRLVVHILVTMVRICVGLIWASAGPLLPFIMREYAISRGTVGWYASAAPIAVAILALPIGIVGARFSLKKMFAVGAFLQAAGLFAPFCNSYPLILLTRIGYALGTAITVPVATAILAEWFSARQLPFVNGITISFVSLGNTLAYVATVPLATALSWRAPITIYGAFALTCALSWVIFGKVKREDGITAQHTAEHKPPKLGIDIKKVLTRRSTVILTLAVMGAWCLSNAMGSWLPTYYHEVFNMPLEKASLITAIITVTAGIIASFLGGILSMRIGRRRPFLMIAGIFMGLFALFSLLFNNAAIILVSVAFFGLFANLHNAIIYTIPMELPGVTPRMGAVVFSFMLATGNFGNFMGPLIVGYLADITGSFLPGFIICALMSLSLFFAGILLPETGPGFRPSTSDF